MNNFSTFFSKTFSCVIRTALDLSGETIWRTKLKNIFRYTFFPCLRKKVADFEIAAFWQCCPYCDLHVRQDVFGEKRNSIKTFLKLVHFCGLRAETYFGLWVSEFQKTSPNTNSSVWGKLLRIFCFSRKINFVSFCRLWAKIFGSIAKIFFWCSGKINGKKFSPKK